MKTILVTDFIGTDFAENKDVARDIRETYLLPWLAAADDVTIDFTGVTGATQSFMHALISEPMRRYGNDVLDKIAFKGCNETIRQIITIVVEYMQETL